MRNTKKWYTSNGVWGSIVTVAAAVAGYFGYGIDTNTQGQIVSNITAIIGAFGGIWALIGRLAANKRIG